MNIINSHRLDVTHTRHIHVFITLLLLTLLTVPLVQAGTVCDDFGGGGANGATATGTNATACGLNATATGNDSVAIGENSTVGVGATSNQSVAIGSDAIVGGTTAASGAIAIGDNANVEENLGVAIGANTTVDDGSTSSTAVGDDTDVLGGSARAVALGFNSQVGGAGLAATAGIAIAGIQKSTEHADPAGNRRRRAAARCRISPAPPASTAA